MGEINISNIKIVIINSSQLQGISWGLGKYRCMRSRLLRIITFVSHLFIAVSGDFYHVYIYGKSGNRKSDYKSNLSFFLTFNYFLYTI